MSKNKVLNTNVVVSAYAHETFLSNNNGRVHSVFPNGFNLIFEDGRIMFVNAQGTYSLSSHGISVDQRVFNEMIEDVQKRDLVRIYDGGKSIRIYTRKSIFKIDFIDYQVINLQIPIINVEENTLVYVNDRLDEMNLLNRSGFTLDRDLAQTLDKIEKEQIMSESSISFLLGRGSGLTPSGDDFLQGYLMMAKAFNSSANEVQSKIKHLLKERTTTRISHAYYDALFEGYTNEFFLIFLSSLQSGNTKELEWFFKNIVNYGKTSGIDTLLGIQMFLKFHFN